MMADFEISGVTESPIVDVFPYVPEAQKIPDNFTKIINGDDPFGDDGEDTEESVEEDDLRLN
jgi:hypothetical protein